MKPVPSSTQQVQIAFTDHFPIIIIIKYDFTPREGRILPFEVKVFSVTLFTPFIAPLRSGIFPLVIFKLGNKISKTPSMVKTGVAGGEDPCLPLCGPVVLEINRLQNQINDKDREVGAAHSEIKALRATAALKDKVVKKVRNEVDKLDEKLRVTQNLLEQKTLECKKLTNEKKQALAAQFSAKASLRRIYVNQKDEDSVLIGSVIAPLEADIKMYKLEIASLHEDKKALERLNKSKESALVESERILKSALERALIVEEVQSQNIELKRQIEICQEENRILDKIHRQKVSEVQKLTQTIKELEEAVLAGGSAANAVHDCRRQISELNKEKKTLERELARVHVSANRVAAEYAGEWKEENDKVIPVKKWLDERRLLQAEMQRLRAKLAASEQTAKAEAQLKDKWKLRLRTLEDGLKLVSTFSYKVKKSTHILYFSSHGGRKQSISQPRASIACENPFLRHQNTEDATADGQLRHFDTLNMKYVNWVSDRCGKTNPNIMTESDVNIDKSGGDAAVPAESLNKESGAGSQGEEDLVSGYLYDILQREVLNLRRLCEIQGMNLSSKDQEILVLVRRVDALVRSIEVELKKKRREAAAHETASARMDDKQKDQKYNLTQLPTLLNSCWIGD